ncbi:MAG TPA: NAD(P)/FAD-dependent oxidoreductase [Candidatus Methanoperedens sp.]|nr:NAD(P)/FAD-dependent oxidoreductase [Candidatus Methanoperedens sp.]
MLKDLVIIGGGPAGNAAALTAADAGLSSIVLVERDAMGGTCTNRGCIPTKFLLSRREGIRSPGSSGDISGEWKRLLAHKSALVRGLSRSIEARCVSRGIEILRGQAQFVSPNELKVTSADGHETRLEGRSFIVATGSEPAQLPGAPPDGERIITSTHALDLASLPGSLAVIGSGPVGAEFCYIFTRLGVRVTLIEAANRLFPQEDPDVDALFRTIYERLGVRVITGEPVVGVERRANGMSVLLRGGAVVEAEKTLVGIGRALGSQGLGCDAAGIAIGPKGDILVGDGLRTSQSHVFAAGDVTGKMLLAHAASFMGEQAARLACGLPARPVPYRSIPWATFTTPEVGSVGLTHEAAERSGIRAVAASVPLMDSVKARIDRTTDGFLKIVAERGSGRIVGGTIIGPHASDLIHAVALAIHQRMTVSDMRGFTFIHPSISELIGDLYSSMNYS